MKLFITEDSIIHDLIRIKKNLELLKNEKENVGLESGILTTRFGATKLIEMLKKDS